MYLSRYLKTYTLPDKPDHLLLFSIRKLSKIIVPKSLMQSINDGTLSPKDEQTLVRLGFLVADPEGERQEMLNALREANSRSRSGSIMAVLNLDCNLACGYCFEGNRKGDHYMSPETADMLVDFASKNIIGQGKDVVFDFYGGEPLLSLDLITDISSKIRKLTDQAGVRYAFTLVTNGTLLTEKTARQLVPLGLKGVKVTLDGPRENHDRSRPFVSGKGSFDVIVKNVKDVCEFLKVQIGGNFTQENYVLFPLLLDYFSAEGLTPERLSWIIFAPVTKTFSEYRMPEFSEGCDSANEPWLLEAGIFLREEILRRGYKTPAISPTICMIECESAVVVNYDGTIYKCPGFIGCPGFETGHLKTGLLDFHKSHNLDVWKKDLCLECAYLPLCFGGCRLLKLLRDGNMDDVECRKTHFDSVLERQLLQDMRYSLKPGAK